MAKPWLTSDDIISAVKRKIMVPISQQTFSEDDILAFANEELAITMVQAVLTAHEEYFVVSKDVSLVVDQTKYEIPDRAIGMKLRDVFYVDTNGSLFEMTRVSQDERAFFQYTSTSPSSIYKYYLEGNDIVLVPEVRGLPSGSLRFVFYLRPNQLVKNERVATITGFRKTITVGTLVAGNSVSIGSTEFEAVAGAPSGNQFQIGGTPSLSASNLTTAIINAGIVQSATSSGAVVSVTYSDRTTTIVSDNSNLSVQSTISLVSSNSPSNLTAGSLIDILQTKAGHRTFNYDVSLVNASAGVYTVSESSLANKVLVGDYIASAHECIIPQIPSDLHIALVEKVCNRILSAMGDMEAVSESAARNGDLENKLQSLIDSRVEGSLPKVSQRHSLLNIGKRGPRRGFY